MVSIPGLGGSPGGGNGNPPSILAWRLPWTEELGWLQSIGLQRVRHKHTHTQLVTFNACKETWKSQVIFIFLFSKIYVMCIPYTLVYDQRKAILKRFFLTHLKSNCKNHTQKVMLSTATNSKLKVLEKKVLVAQSCLTLRSHGLQHTRLLCPWDFPYKNTGVGCHFLLQGSSRPRDWTWVPCIASRFFTI